MIRYEVIVRIKPGVPRASIDQALAHVRQLIGDIAGVERIRTGANNTPDYRHAMVVIDLQDEMAIQRMQRHPLHTRAVRTLGRLAESTAVGSYLVTSDHQR